MDDIILEEKGIGLRIMCSSCVEAPAGVSQGLHMHLPLY